MQFITSYKLHLYQFLSNRNWYCLLKGGKGIEPDFRNCLETVCGLFDQSWINPQSRLKRSETEPLIRMQHVCITFKLNYPINYHNLSSLASLYIWLLKSPSMKIGSEISSIKMSIWMARNIYIFLFLVLH